MINSWRWYGPADPVTIEDVMQVGVTDVVTALHHIPNGEIWTVEEIQKRQCEVQYSKKLSRETGLTWSVVESVPVHEDIKKRTGDYKRYIENYKKSIENLAKCGIFCVVYNFMPILDWTRTDLFYELNNGVKALRYHHPTFVAFDAFILKRDGANLEYSKIELEQAKKVLELMNEDERERLVRTMIKGLPGSEESFALENFREALETYKNISKEQLRSNLVEFLKEIIPVAKSFGVKMAIHPDDPPRDILGLPRVMSTHSDIDYILEEIPEVENGITLCVGSWGVSRGICFENIISRWGERIHFTHLRNVLREEDGMSFYEAAHLEGSSDMYSIVKNLLLIEKKFNKEIYLRPDHGHLMLDDMNKKTNPGYSCIGRMKGLAEIKGIIYAIEHEIQGGRDVQ